MRAHASSPDFAVWKLRLRTRHLKLIMGCVECNVCKVRGTVLVTQEKELFPARMPPHVCKVHGTVLVIGLASTLQARLEV